MTPLPPPAATVLCVDDEPNILASLQRVLRRARLGVLTAPGGAQALALLEHTPVDVVISDMHMPDLDGAQLLETVAARWPQVVRLMLTGRADMPSTLAAINRGQVFRYLQKPWNEVELVGAVEQGLERQALQRETQRLQALTRQRNEELQALNAELEARVQARTAALQEAADRLRRNHLKAIKVFSNLLELRGPALAGHGRRVADGARSIARAMRLPEDACGQVFVAGLLHDVGLIGLGDALLAKPVGRYTAAEQALYRDHPVQAEQSLLALDDLHELLPLVRGHHEHFDGSGFPDGLAGAAIPLGARIVAVADAFDELQSGHLCAGGVSRQEARALLRQGRGSRFDPEVVDVFLHITEPARPREPPSRALGTGALEAGMVLARDLVSARGMLMLTAGHRLSPALIARIRDFEQHQGERIEIHVRPKGEPCNAS
ncbi:MAG: response regulator [Rubrivivax sp.]